jgi:hypothetical protein
MRWIGLALAGSIAVTAGEGASASATTYIDLDAQGYSFAYDNEYNGNQLLTTVTLNPGPGNCCVSNIGTNFNDFFSTTNTAARALGGLGVLGSSSKGSLLILPQLKNQGDYVTVKAESFFFYELLGPKPMPAGIPVNVNYQVNVNANMDLKNGWGSTEAESEIYAWNGTYSLSPPLRLHDSWSRTGKCPATAR